MGLVNFSSYVFFFFFFFLQFFDLFNPQEPQRIATDLGVYVKTKVGEKKTRTCMFSFYCNNFNIDNRHNHIPLGNVEKACTSSS